MEAAKAICWIYRLALVRAVELLRGNLAIIFAPLAYSVLLSFATVALRPLGIVGRIVLMVAGAACASSGLHLIENVVRMGKASLNDFARGFRVYLSEILGIAFILWLPMTLLTGVAYSTPEGPAILVLVQAILYITLNAVPELIYQTRASGLALLSASYHFIVENWIEWFLPNVLIAAAAYPLRGLLYGMADSMPVFLQMFFIAAVFGLFLTFLMIFRGVLFSELHGTTRRSRTFRYHARSA